MLLEIAIGDAYGAGMEYVSTKFLKEHNNLNSYCAHPRHTITPGNYTDDTQMSIAITEAIIEDADWSTLELATRFLKTFKRDPREGYAQGFYHFLNQTTDGEEFVRNIRPDSDKSGAAMRSSPIGIYPSYLEVIKKATIQASVTHNTELGINSSIATALMSHYFIYNLGPRENLGSYLNTYVKGKWDIAWQGKVGAKGEMSVRAAVTAIMQADNLKDILKISIDFGGDVDTVAAIAMGAAACSKNIIKNLPLKLISSLENKAYGRQFISDLDKKLNSKFGNPIKY